MFTCRQMLEQIESNLRLELPVTLRLILFKLEQIFYMQNSNIWFLQFPLIAMTTDKYFAALASTSCFICANTNGYMSFSQLFVWLDAPSPSFSLVFMYNQHQVEADVVK